MSRVRFPIDANQHPFCMSILRVAMAPKRDVVLLPVDGRVQAALFTRAQLTCLNGKMAS